MRFESGSLEGSTTNGFDEEVVVDESTVLSFVGDDAFDSEDGDDDDGEELKEAKGYKRRPRLCKGRPPRWIETETESCGVEMEVKRAIGERERETERYFEVEKRWLGISYVFFFFLSFLLVGGG